MSSIQETAYPRLKSVVSTRDLLAIYTPTTQDSTLAEQVTRNEGSRLCFLILLKTFQRLGYFVLLQEVPEAIRDYIAQCVQANIALTELDGYDRSGTRKRHLQVIRQTLHIQPYGKEARHQMLLAMQEAAKTREAMADIINAAIEELVRQKYELPAFDTLTRGARHARAVVYRQFYQQVDAALSATEKADIERLFAPESESRFTAWNLLKQEPGNPTLTHLKHWLDRRVWLAKYSVGEQALKNIPDVKVKHFAAEARTLDAARMLEMEPQKRMTLSVCLLKVQSARGLPSNLRTDS